MTLVKNIKGTSNEHPPSGYLSWLDYWERSINRKATVCSATDCSNSLDMVGAHIEEAYMPKGKYIIPLCKTCNQRQDAFWVPNIAVKIK